MSEDDIEKLVTDYAHKYWAADRTVSRREDAEIDAAMDRIMGEIKTGFENLRLERDRAVDLLAEASKAVIWVSGPSHKLALEISEFLAPHKGRIGR